MSGPNQSPDGGAGGGVAVVAVEVDDASVCRKTQHVEGQQRNVLGLHAWWLQLHAYVLVLHACNVLKCWCWRALSPKDFCIASSGLCVLLS